MRLFMVATLLLTAMLTSAQDAQHSNPNGTATREKAVVNEIKALEAELARAVMGRDYGAIRRIEADSYVYTDSDAHVNTRDEFIEAYRSGKSQIPMLQFHDIAVDVYGDTAVVRGILTVDRTDNGVRLSRSSRYTRVYVHFPEGWRAVVGHSSQLEQPPASTTLESGAALDPVKRAPGMYSVLFENSHIRAIDYHLKPGEKEPMHSHVCGVFVYFFTDANIRSTTSDGKTTEAHNRAGDVVWRDPVTHFGENIGTTEAHALLIEPTAGCKTPVSSAGGRGTNLNGNFMPKAASDAEQVLAVDEARRQAMLNADGAALSDLLADDVTIFWGDGTRDDKQSTLALFRSGRLRYSQLEYENTRVRFYANTAVLTGEAHVRLQSDGQVMAHHVHVTRVYVRDQSRWRLVASQTTRMPSEQ